MTQRFLNFLVCFFLSMFTVLSTWWLFTSVDLEPHVEPHFFFSESDLAYQADKKIKDTFPEPEQTALAIQGPIRSPEYRDRIQQLSTDLLGLAPVFAVQSITMGPKNSKAAFESPLWKRMLISKDGYSTVIMAFTDGLPEKDFYWELESLADHYTRDDFRVLISGAPYIIDLIRRHLVGDMQIFSLAAFGIFTVVMLFIFRSLRVLLGTMVACMNSGVATLFATHFLAIKIGPLTANLSTMVFVLTLSHIAYMTFNWKHEIDNPEDVGVDSVRQALKVTIIPSFWSMLTTFLGFGTLIFVEATPFRMLGISGSIGTVIAFLSAYIFYPPFLRWKLSSPETLPPARPVLPFMTRFLKRRHPLLVIGLLCLVIAAGTGLSKIDTDPSLLSYFKPGSELREGLEYVDRNWGSSPLKIVLEDHRQRSMMEEEVYEDLNQLQESIEHYPGVGSALSIPLVLAEGKAQAPFSFLWSETKILEELEKEKYGQIAEMFLTPDRQLSLLLFRMRSGEREEPRKDIIDRLKDGIVAGGFTPQIVGGMYLLQGELAQVVLKSLFTGLAMLLGLFILMGLFLSRSFSATLALLLGLITIPTGLLGLVGHLKVPLDMIAAPATNLAVAMGVDAMIHLIIMVRRCSRSHMNNWAAWAEARMRVWKPVLSSAMLVCTGFAIFTTSYFPPTQRFGLMIVVGSLIAPLATLIILPTLAGRKSDPDIVE